MTDSSIKDGGPAFPILIDVVTGELSGHGLSVRDYFAIAALQAEETGEWTPEYFPALATRCYSIADAMLKERAK